MVRFCPQCWQRNPYEAVICESCGANLREESGDRVDRLIVSLAHPLGQTRQLVATLLGKTGDPRAVQALNEAVPRAIEGHDWELLDGLVAGLAASGRPEAVQGLTLAAEKGYLRARRAARTALARRAAVGADEGRGL
jgi:HEAT repeat protein